MAHVEIEAKGIRARFEPAFGMISELVVERDGRTVSMLHKAPWIGEKMPEDAAPHLGGLAGDFFCAPFGDASADNAPGHGWPANSLWTHLGTERKGGETVARFRLDRKAMGADLVKELRLVDGHPFLYQRHIFTGGHAEGMSVANHAMVSLPNGGQLSFSPKRWWETPQIPLEPDPARGRSPARLPGQGDRSPGISRSPPAARPTSHAIRSPRATRISPSASRRKAASSAGRRSRAARRATSSSACATRRGCR